MSSQGQLQTVAKQGREGMQKQRRRNKETTVQQGQGSSSRNIHNNTSLSPSAGTKAPTLVEDGNSWLSTGFLEHRPVTSPPTNQKKAIHPGALTPNFAYKYFSLKTVGEFGVFSKLAAPDSLSGAYNRRCTFLHYNPVSVD